LRGRVKDAAERSNKVKIVQRFIRGYLAREKVAVSLNKLRMS